MPEILGQGRDRFVIDSGGGRSRRTSTDPTGRVIKDEASRHLRSLLVQVPEELHVRTLGELLPVLGRTFVSGVTTPDEDLSMLDRLDLRTHHRWDLATSVEVVDPPGAALSVVVTFFRPPTSEVTEIEWVAAGLYRPLPFGRL